MGDDAELVAALRRGDEAAFAGLVDTWGPALLRLARAHVPSHAVAEEVVQETWLAVLRGIDGFQGRSPLRAWVFGILLNLARTHGRRERRMLPFASLRRRGDDGPAEPPERFQGRRGEHPGGWASPPAPWADPHERLEADAARAVVRKVIAELPARQREAILLRDVLGFPPREACGVLGTTEGSERVLVHRARARVRAALERHMREEGVG
ncbi:MAG: RNA polymerase sigma factor [Actinomycetota bacterium]